jgi:Fe-S-cluster-containing dehydrogenase component
MPKLGNLVANPRLCTGCQACVVICSFFKVSNFDPISTRIRIARNEPECSFTPHFCRHCGKPSCQPACPTSAIVRDETTGMMYVVPELCDGCGQCIKACPFDAIRLDRNHIATMCNLCNGQPMCAQLCEPKALLFVR